MDGVPRAGRGWGRLGPYLAQPDALPERRPSESPRGRRGRGPDGQVDDGIVAEPYSDWQEIAGKHPDKVIVAGGDNRVIARNNRDEIFAMVEEMARIGKPLPGYFMSCVNHLPWNLPIEGMKAYFEASEEFGYR